MVKNVNPRHQCKPDNIQFTMFVPINQLFHTILQEITHNKEHFLSLLPFDPFKITNTFSRSRKRYNWLFLPPDYSFPSFSVDGSCLPHNNVAALLHSLY